MAGCRSGSMGRCSSLALDLTRLLGQSRADGSWLEGKSRVPGLTTSRVGEGGAGTMAPLCRCLLGQLLKPLLPQPPTHTHSTTLFAPSSRSDSWEAAVSAFSKMAAPRVAIVGGGLAGLAAAKALLSEGMACSLLDMGARGVGGRLVAGRLPAAAPMAGCEHAAAVLWGGSAAMQHHHHIRRWKRAGCCFCQLGPAPTSTAAAPRPPMQGGLPPAAVWQAGGTPQL